MHDTLQRLHVKMNKIQNAINRMYYRNLPQDPWWASGLIDADGHIGLEFTDAKKTKIVPCLKVSLKNYNARAVYTLKAILGVGRIGTSHGMVTLRVRSRRLWYNVLLPHFETYPLRSYKFHQVQLIKDALSKPERGHELSKAIRDVSNLKREPFLQQAVYSDNDYNQLFPIQWLAGFIEGDGSFYILNNGAHGFACGQKNIKNNIMMLLHARLNIPSRLKVRADGYSMIDSKNSIYLKQLGAMLKPHMRGIKSAELRLWLRSLNSLKRDKKIRARRILHKTRNQTRFSS